MYLSNMRCLDLIENGQIRVFDVEQDFRSKSGELVGPAGLLLTIQAIRLPAQIAGIASLNPTGKVNVWDYKELPEGIVSLPPLTSTGALTPSVVLISREQIRLGPGLIGFPIIRSSFTAVHCTLAGYPLLPMDPPSQIMGTLTNNGLTAVDLAPGMLFAELLIARMESTTDWSLPFQRVFNTDHPLILEDPDLPPHVRDARDRYRATHPEA